MTPAEHRITRRFKLHTPLSFHRMETANDCDHQATAINVSTRGVYFKTNVVLSIGEALELLLEIPTRVSGVKAGTRRFVGRVSHVESKNMLPGLSGIGVQLLYYERDLVKIADKG
jgi:hypothetical protein